MAIAPVTNVKDASRSALTAVQNGISSSEIVYQSLHDFIYGKAEPPSWDAFLGQWRSALDQMKQGANELDLLTSKGS